MMQNNTPQLEKKAIRLALDERWEEAIAVNQEILETSPNDVKTNLRLGKAYLQLKDFSSAQQTFEKVLELDPINSIAKKNIELAKNKKSHTVLNSGRALVKEPGTTCECEANITKRGLNSEDIPYGQILEANVLKTKINVTLNGETVAEVSEEDIVKRFNRAISQDAEVYCSFIKGNGKTIKLLCNSSVAVFKSDKQDVKPYVRKGAIEEPELEVESFDDSEEEEE